MSKALKPRDTTSPAQVVDLLLQRKAKHTADTYRADYRDFARWAGLPIPDALGQLVEAGQGAANRIVAGYRVSLGERGLSAATINRRLCALRSFVREARRFGQISWGLDVEGVRSKPYRDTAGPGIRVVGSVLERLQADRAIAKPGSARAARCLRDLVMVRLMFEAGLRRIEIARLDLADVESDRARIWILGKTRSEKEPVSLTTKALGLLVEWIAIRGESPGPLFTSFHRDPAHRTQRLSLRGISIVLSNLGKTLNVRLTAHGIRHTAITAALDATAGDIRGVQSFARHGDPRVTMRYDDRRTDRPLEISEQISRAVDEKGNGNE